MSYLAQATELNFTNGFYAMRSRPLSSQRCINYYPIPSRLPALSNESLQMTEGLTELIAGLGGITRGAETVNGVPYFVVGQKLYRIDRVVNPDLSEEYSAVELGDIAGTRRVIMVSGYNPTAYQLAIIVPSEHAYGYDGTTLTDLFTLTNFRGPVDDVVNINGFFFFLQADANIIFHSNLNDILTYNALDFEQVIQVTQAVGLQKFRNQLFVMGESETVPFVYIGGTNFVLRAQPNAVMDWGLRSVYAKTRTKAAFAFLGSGQNEEPAVWLFNGGYPQKISTNAVDELLQDLNTLDEAFIFNFARKGADIIGVIAGDECICFDLTTGKWHERKSLIAGEQRRWRVNTIIKAYDKLLVGDFTDGRIGLIDDQEFTEYGESIQREVNLQPYDNRGKALRVQDLMIAMDVGFGGEVALSYSDDGGFTYSNIITREAGAIGEYGRMIQYDRLGSAPFSRVLRIGTSSNCKTNINKLLVKAA